MLCCGNCREKLVLCVVGNVGNRYCSVLWELYGTGTIVCCGICREQIVLCVVGIAGNKLCSVLLEM